MFASVLRMRVSWHALDPRAKIGKQSAYYTRWTKNWNLMLWIICFVSQQQQYSRSCMKWTSIVVLLVGISYVTIFCKYSDMYGYLFQWGTAVAQWLSCCATNRKIGVLVPAGVIGIFRWHNPSDRTMSLGSTQPLTEMSARSISWG